MHAGAARAKERPRGYAAAGTEFCLDFNRFEKQKRWRWLSGQDNRENNSAHFSCAHVFTQPGSFSDFEPRPGEVR
jgi:hypothetical protein